jgi:hypothetical protein
MALCFILLLSINSIFYPIRKKDFLSRCLWSHIDQYLPQYRIIDRQEVALDLTQRSQTEFLPVLLVSLILQYMIIILQYDRDSLREPIHIYRIPQEFPVLLDK